MIKTDLCEILNFAEAKALLMDINFFGKPVIIKEEAINERHIFDIAEMLKVSPGEWRHVPGWPEFEYGNRDFTPDEFLAPCFDGLDYQNERFLIITIDSYTTRKLFLVESQNLLGFIENYDKLSGVHIDFIQPMDYLFFLSHQKTVVYLNTDGIFKQFRFGG